MKCFILHTGSAALCALAAHWMFIVVGGKGMLRARDLAREVLGTTSGTMLILVLLESFRVAASIYCLTGLNLPGVRLMLLVAA